MIEGEREEVFVYIVVVDCVNVMRRHMASVGNFGYWTRGVMLSVDVC